MRGYAEKLQALGYEIHSSWIYEPLDPPVPPLTCAMRDLDELAVSDLLIAFTEGPIVSDRNTGGRHVEFGYAIATGIDCFVVGELENVFHHLTEVRHFPTFDDLMAVMESTAATSRSL